MQFKDHLIELFEFNDKTNKRLFKKIGSLDDQTECIRFASHLINCQYKWMARLGDDERANAMSWWEPPYSPDPLEEEWGKSTGPWFAFDDRATAEELNARRG